MVDPIMLLVAHVNYSIIRAKAVCMQCCREFHFAANNGLNTGLFAVRDDLCLDAAISLIDAEDDRLTSCSTSTFATHPSSTEVRFIQLDIARERRFSFTMLYDGLANQSQISVHCITVQATQYGDLNGSQIKCKELENLPKFSTGNSCADKLLRTDCHDSV
jgi:hypothetical protein